MENKEKLGKQTKKKNLKTKIVAPALAGVLMLSGTASGQGSKIEDEIINKKEIVVNPTEEKSSDTTIDYNSARAFNSNETDEISTEEIREFIMNNKDEIMSNINDVTREKIYDELIHNRGIFKMVKKLTYDEEVREAALNGDNETILKKVNKEIEKAKRIDVGRPSLSLGFAIGMIVSYFISRKVEKDYEKKKKEKEGNNEQ